jgi:site-specific recombinase XerD
MKLTDCLQQYLTQYLVQIKGAGNQTIATYRQGFELFLKFAAANLKVAVSQLTLDDITPDLIIAFLDHLEHNRHNGARTRNSRLAALKSLAKMIRLLYPQYRDIAEMILHLPAKRCQKSLVGFLTHEEVIKVLEAINLQRKDGMRDYTLLQLLYDSGCRASEVAELKLSGFDPQNKRLAVLGKGNRYRLIKLWRRTTDLLTLYIVNHRPIASALHNDSLFLNQRKQPLTRHGIYRLCRKYLSQSLLEKRLQEINPVHSFRHACAVNMLLSGCDLTEIKNHLGHENLASTMVYLHLDLPRKREVQKRLIEYCESTLSDDCKINDLIDWENKV